jgi:hypothetical protein
MAGDLVCFCGKARSVFGYMQLREKGEKAAKKKEITL